MNPEAQTVSTFASAAIIYFVQKFLKTRPSYATFVEKLPGAAKWAHRVVAAVGSLIAAVGIHITFSGNYNTGWQFQGSIPDIWTLLHAGWDFVEVFALQQMAYETTKARPWYPHMDAQP